MTIDEFFEELKLIKDKFKWTVCDRNYIRGNTTYCPLTALIYIKTGKDLPSFFYRKGVEHLKMDIKDLDAIASASDWSGEKKSDLRKKLEHILELK